MTKNLLTLQRDETTLCEVYRRLAGLEKDPVRRRTLLRIMQDERRHCEVLRSRTGRTVTPDPKRVLWYVGMVRVLGRAFVVRQMEQCEKGTAASYSRYPEREEFVRIASEERRHGEELTTLAGGMRLCYISSVVLGLNDALVEFTGALAGFTLALNEPRLVALTGGITGIAAALSMAASEGEASASGCGLHRGHLSGDGRHTDTSLSALFECACRAGSHASGGPYRDRPVQLLLRRGPVREFQTAFFRNGPAEFRHRRNQLPDRLYPQTVYGCGRMRRPRSPFVLSGRPDPDMRRLGRPLKKTDSQHEKYFSNNFNLNGIPFAGIPVSFIT